MPPSEEESAPQSFFPTDTAEHIPTGGKDAVIMHQKVMSNLLLIYAAVPRKAQVPVKAPVKSDFMELELGRNFAKDAHELDIFGTIGDFKEKIPVLHGERDGTVPNQNLSVHF